jgi:hypothetical protein
MVKRYLALSFSMAYLLKIIREMVVFILGPEGDSFRIAKSSN